MGKVRPTGRATSEPVQSHPTITIWGLNPPYQALSSSSLGTMGSQYPQRDNRDLAACSGGVGKKGSWDFH